MPRPPNYEFQEWWNKQRDNGHELLQDKSDVSNPTTPFFAVEIGSPNSDPTVEKEVRTRSARQLSGIYLIKFQQIAAYFKGWHFSPPSVGSAELMVELLYAKWLEIRADYLGPPLKGLSNMCIVLFLVQSVDRVALVLGCLWIKLKRLKPTAVMEYPVGDVEGENVEDYPMVLLQIPMCNEREVYQQSIAAVCIQDWPRERMLIQVLDDSDDLDVQHLLKAEVQKWQQRGVRILYRHRLIRTGYKAGNLKSAMGCDYVKDYEFVAIFDADFQPGPDFLKKTIPYFKVNGIFINFFGFNGTAGVWRIRALEECGGWLERTTVEDMDIAVRAHLCGWKFVYLNDVKSLCELPESYEAYKKQQYRWHSGPMQLFRLCFVDILRSKVSWTKKANLIFLFFLLRKLILPFYSFTLFCIILPLTMFIPEAELPAWVVSYVPGIMSILNILPAPRSFPFIVPYLLFENTISSEADLVAFAEKESETLVDSSSLLRSSSESGLDELNKLEITKKAGVKKRNRLYRKELALAFILLTASVRSLLSAQGIHFYFLLFQGITFLVVGLDLIGEQAIKENLTRH
ncbi:hypothetical protein Patl1_01514 [Pistacia atlantica]|uniref:Uncharacterized protein n=1 Tax=Pistacia atlantica TaxID=434234 RepID=A0ACC1CDJ8_9ROSI|nr:hypothetical protein Patl1_01514 [Pistacia atlantica]